MVNHVAVHILYKNLYWLDPSLLIGILVNNLAFNFFMLKANKTLILVMLINVYSSVLPLYRLVVFSILH